MVITLVTNIAPLNFQGSVEEELHCGVQMGSHSAHTVSSTGEKQ